MTTPTTQLDEQDARRCNYVAGGLVMAWCANQLRANAKASAKAARALWLGLSWRMWFYPGVLMWLCAPGGAL